MDRMGLVTMQPFGLQEHSESMGFAALNPSYVLLAAYLFFRPPTSDLFFPACSLRSPFRPPPSCSSSTGRWPRSRPSLWRGWSPRR